MRSEEFTEWGPHRGDVRCGIFDFLYGSASLGWKGRAAVQLVNQPIPARFDRFKPDEPEHGANPA